MRRPAEPTATPSPGAGATRRGESPWRNPWVLAWIGLVAVVLLANLVMVSLAILTNPGLVVEDYYEKGQQYAERRLARRLSEPRGWQVRLDLPGELLRNVPLSLRVAAIDERGLPVQADAARFFAYRPSDAAADFELELRPVAPGIVSAEVQFPLPGLWDLIVQVQAGDRVYDLARRVVVRDE